LGRLPFCRVCPRRSAFVRVGGPLSVPHGRGMVQGRHLVGSPYALPPSGERGRGVVGRQGAQAAAVQGRCRVGGRCNIHFALCKPAGKRVVQGRSRVALRCMVGRGLSGRRGASLEEEEEGAGARAAGAGCRVGEPRCGFCGRRGPARLPAGAWPGLRGRRGQPESVGRWGGGHPRAVQGGGGGARRGGWGLQQAGGFFFFFFFFLFFSFFFFSFFFFFLPLFFFFLFLRVLCICLRALPPPSVVRTLG